jgi:hypothetical protein
MRASFVSKGVAEQSQEGKSEEKRGLENVCKQELTFYLRHCLDSRGQFFRRIFEPTEKSVLMYIQKSWLLANGGA